MTSSVYQTADNFGPQPDPVTQIRQALELLTDPGQVIELRIPKAGKYRTISGYFDSPDPFAKVASRWSGKVPGVYFTLNPCQPALLARANNRAVQYAERTTIDPDIERRCLLLLDFDARRPAGISSTDTEHEAAIAKARDCLDWLTAQGWPRPVLADSGNGGHLLYRIQLPNDEPTKTLVARCLKAAAARLDDETVEVDKTVFNAARICKIYGTLVCKGDHTPDRPHRVARILEAPPALEIVPIEKLTALAAEIPEEPKPQSRQKSVDHGSDNFFGNVNAESMARLSAWVPRLFPDAKPYREGYRVSSKALNRGLEEDLSLLPTGIRDFGEEAGKTPIDLVIQWMPAADAKTAADWLCDQIGMDPESLGWKTNQLHTTDWGQRGQRGHPHGTKAEAGPSVAPVPGTVGTNLPDADINPPCFAVHLQLCRFEGPNEENRNLKPGVWWHGVKETKDGTEITHTWICSPLTVEAITAGDTGADFGRLLRFVDSNKHWHEWAMPMRLLKGSGEELRGELLDQGVLIDPRSRSLLPQYLMSRYPKRRVLAATRIGWHGNAFVLPDQVIGTADVVFQSEVASLDDFSPAGTLDGWRQEIGHYAVGNIPLTVSIATALTGPLLYQVNRQGGGIHWMGDSSTGKSTAIEVAASCWGSPEFVRSWSATANGFEAVAAARNDTILLLDEIGEASPYEVGRIAYMLANGQGKQRAGRTGTARSLQRWRLMTLSTGEKSLTAIMADIGRKPNAGQMVRLLAIPVDFKYGAFDNLHGFPDGRALADHLKRARTQHYGHIGPVFVEKLLNDARDHGANLAKLTEALAVDAKTTLEGRAAGVFAMIGLAGELGIEYGLLPWPPGSAIEAAKTVFQRWQAAQIHPNSEEAQILQNIVEFIGRHGDSRFSPLGDYSDRAPIRDRAGWYRDTDSGDRVFLFLAAAMDEAGGDFDRKRIAQALDRVGWLTEKDPGRLTYRIRTPTGRPHLYHVLPGEEAS